MTRVCARAGCGEGIPADAHGNTRYCSDACRYPELRDVACARAGCGRLFTPSAQQGGHLRYCGDRCARLARAASQAQRPPRRWTPEQRDRYNATRRAKRRERAA